MLEQIWLSWQWTIIISSLALKFWRGHTIRLYLHIRSLDHDQNKK